MTSQCEGPNHLLDFSDFKIGAHVNLIIFSNLYPINLTKKISNAFKCPKRTTHIFYVNGVTRIVPTSRIDGSKTEKEATDPLIFPFDEMKGMRPANHCK